MTNIDNLNKSARTDYERALKLLGAFTRCTHLLAALESRANSKLVALAEKHAHKFATLQSKITESEAEIKALAEKHPEWFPDDDRTVKSLLGSIHAQKTTSLEIGNEDAVIAAIENEIEQAKLDGRHEAVAHLQPCLVKSTTLSREALGLVPDEILQSVGIQRVKSDNITVKPAKVKLGNAVKKAAQVKAKKATKVEPAEAVAA